MSLAFLTAGLWAFTIICANRAARLVGGAACNFARLSLALLLLALWGHLFGTGLRGAALPWFLLSGAIGFGIGDIGAFEAMPLIGSQLTALFISCLSAPIAMLLEWLWLDTGLTGFQLLFGLITLAGVAIVLTPRNHPHLSRRTWIVGSICGFVAAVGQGAGAVLSRKAFQVTHEAHQLIDAGTVSYQRAIGGLVIVAAFQAYRHRSVDQRPPTNWPRAWPWILAHVLTGPTLGVICYQWALSTAPSGIVLPICALTPLAVIPFAYFMDGERPSPRALVGGTIAVAGSVGLTLVK